MNKEILEGLKDAVIAGNVKRAKRLAELAIDQGLSVNTALDMLIQAMKTVDERYKGREYFVIDVASSASAMQEAFKILKPHLKVEPAVEKGKIIIGSLKGNIQGLGKEIVAATLQSAGFQVVNLGIDVAPKDFVETAIREKAQIIAISITMEETVQYLKDIVNILKKENLRSRIKVIIGGNAVSRKTCSDYKLDAFAVDAQDCLNKVKALLS